MNNKTDLIIKDWYIQEYPNDELGVEIKDTITFEDLHKALQNGDDVYEFLGVDDSIVRERCFDKLAQLLGKDYEYIYYLWLDNGEDFDDFMKKYVVKESLNESTELDRQAFVSLVKLGDKPYNGYSILNDGNFVKRLYADSDEDAISQFRDWIGRGGTGLKESVKLTEGTSNFWSQEDLPLYAFLTVDEAADKVRYMVYSDPEYDEEDDDKYYELEDKYYTELENDGYAVIDLDDGELYNAIDEVNDLIAHLAGMAYDESYKLDRELENNEYSDEEYDRIREEANEWLDASDYLDDLKLGIKSGYYEGAQLYLDGWDKYFIEAVPEDYRQQIVDAYNKIGKDFGLMKLGVAYHASNGETGYNIIKEDVSYTRQQLIDAVKNAYGFTNKEALAWIKRASEESKKAIVDGFRQNARRNFYDESLKESETLTERAWRYELKNGSKLRRAIQSGDYEDIRQALIDCYDELLDKGFIDEYDHDDWTEEVRDYDFESDDDVDFELEQLYDLCDNIDVFVALDSDDEDDLIGESVEDAENPLKDLRSNVLELSDGDYMYVEYKDGKLYAGPATNVGLMPVVTIDYDRDLSVDQNLQNLYDEIEEGRTNESLKEATTPEQRARRRGKLTTPYDKTYTLTLKNKYNYTVIQYRVNEKDKTIEKGLFNWGDGKGSFFDNSKELQRHIDDLLAQGYKMIESKDESLNEDAKAPRALVKVGPALPRNWVIAKFGNRFALMSVREFDKAKEDPEKWFGETMIELFPSKKELIKAFKREPAYKSIFDGIEVNESLKEDWYHFEYESGANPYIAKSERERDRIIRKYQDRVEDLGSGNYLIHDKEEDLFSVDMNESLEGRDRKKFITLLTNELQKEPLAYSRDEANDIAIKRADALGKNPYDSIEALVKSEVSKTRSKKDESLKEDTVKQGNAWVNKGKEGTHGKFKTKKAADAQRKAMFANGYKESLKESADMNVDEWVLTKIREANAPQMTVASYFDSSSWENDFETRLIGGDTKPLELVVAKWDNPDHPNRMIKLKSYPIKNGMTMRELEAQLKGNKEPIKESKEEDLTADEIAYKKYQDGEYTYQDYVDVCTQEECEPLPEIKESLKESADDDVLYIATSTRGNDVKVFSSLDARYKHSEDNTGWQYWEVPKKEFKSLAKQMNRNFAFNRLHQEGKTKVSESLKEAKNDYIGKSFDEVGKQIRNLGYKEDKDNRQKDADRDVYTYWKGKNNLISVYVKNNKVDEIRGNLIEEALDTDFDDKKVRDEVVGWWDAVEKWNDEHDRPYDIDNGDKSDVEAMHAAMFDMLIALRDEQKDSDEAKALVKDGKRVYNKYSVSRFESLDTEKVEEGVGATVASMVAGKAIETLGDMANQMIDDNSFKGESVKEEKKQTPKEKYLAKRAKLKEESDCSEPKEKPEFLHKGDWVWDDVACDWYDNESGDYHLELVHNSELPLGDSDEDLKYVEDMEGFEDFKEELEESLENVPIITNIFANYNID